MNEKMETSGTLEKCISVEAGMKWFLRHLSDTLTAQKEVMKELAK